MIARLLDIPEHGLELNFELDAESIDERIDAVRKAAPQGGILPPAFNVEGAVLTKLFLELQGSSVLLRGTVSAQLKTDCTRCAEDMIMPLSASIEMVLKPRPSSPRRDADGEDLSFGYYENDEINCGELVEEALVLKIPIKALCQENCKGLCSSCGANLNNDQCSCKEQVEGDERFNVLKQLKLH